MKKVLAFILALCLMLTPMALVGCGDEEETTVDNRDPLTKFYDKLNEKENFTMELSMSVMGVSVSQTFKYSGDIMYTEESLMSKESYTVETETGVEEYTKNVFGKWTKNNYASNAEEDANDIFAEEMDSLFKPDSYTINKNVYTQKDDVDFENFKDVVLTLEDGKCIIDMTMMIEGMGLDITLTLSKVGQSALTLPTEYVNVDINDSPKGAKEALQGNGFTTERYTTGVYIDAILEGWGAYGADANSIVIGEKGNESVILVYCSDDASAEIMYETFMTMLDDSYEEVVSQDGVGSNTYNEFYELNKDTVIGRDGNVVCLTTTPDGLAKAK